MRSHVCTALSLVLACSLVTGCKKPDSTGTVGGEVKVDGSSTVFMLTEVVIEEFFKANGDKIRVTGARSGTGGGFKKFCAGELEVCGASRPITAEEMDLCKKAGIEYIELPICFDALTVAVHKDATWVDSIKTSELKRLWEPEATGKIEKWSDIRKEWPNEKFQLYGAGNDSGTFEYFSEAVVERKKSTRTDYNKSEDDNSLVIGIAGNKYALGYLPYSYFVESKDKLKALAIDWDKDPAKSKGPVAPSVDAVIKGQYNPLSRPLFIYVNKKAAARPEVKQFVDFYLEHAKKLAEAVSFIPLPEAAYAMGIERFNKLQSGTGFAGHAEIGLPLEEILKREPKN
jgi:phosphate transport system substrate-binding protein